MEEHQGPQVLELCQSVVRGTYGLIALFATDTNANISFTYHRYIISSVSYCQSNQIWQFFSD